MLRASSVTQRNPQPRGRFPRLKGMRARLLALASLSALVAGCGTATVPGTAGQPASSAPAAASSAAPSAASGSAPAAGAAAGTAQAGASCSPATAAAAVQAGALTGLEFVSPAQGWAVGQDAILATSDGGAHWTAQLSGQLNLTSVDFISAKDGWAAGPTSLLATTDGGAHWTALPEPCQVIRSVHFISPATGFAVAGGQSPSGQGPALPVTGGTVLATGDGGRTWHTVAAPANAQSVCFSDPQHGWLGANGLLYRTADGGKNWTKLTSMAGQVGSGGPAGMSVECADNGTAWALRVGPGAAMSQDPHVGYYGNARGAVPLFAEQYFQTPGTTPTAQAPGSDAGPFSAIDSQTAVFVDWCSACGAGTAPWELVTNAGKPLAKGGNVGSVTAPQAASFQSQQLGWVAGTDTVLSGSGTGKSQERIVATTDGGRTWHVQWSGPWSVQH
jgi:photosystem II stability/assembly factor-like uncharacterized protein